MYAFTLSDAGTGEDMSRMFFEWNGTVTDVFPDGQAMSQDIGDQPGNLWFGYGAAATGDRVFQVTTVPQPTSGYHAWAGFFTPAVGGPTSDDDSDGVANGLEWILGGNPLLPDPADCGPTILQTDPDSFTFEFRRNPDSLTSAPLVVEWDTDLSGIFAHSIPVGATSFSDQPPESR